MIHIRTSLGKWGTKVWTGWGPVACSYEYLSDHQLLKKNSDLYQKLCDIIDTEIY